MNPETEKKQPHNEEGVTKNEPPVTAPISLPDLKEVYQFYPHQ